MIKKLCVISSYYPSEMDPHYSFVGTLVSAVADMGAECCVISPVSNLEKRHRGVTRVETTPGGAKIRVYCPPYLVFPSRNLLGFETYRLTAASKRSAVKKVFDSEIGDCDAIYSHFVESGAIAAWLSEKTGIPAFVAVGESSIRNKRLDYTVFKKELHRYVRGVVSVSSQLKEDCRREDVFSPDTPIEVFPNAIDTGLFRPLDRRACREKLGIPPEAFTVSFVGGFIPRKGFDRLQEAVARHPDWKCILIGSGEMPVTLPSGQVAFSGKLPHDQIPAYLCASDVFVLPTLAEGCCNAIIEALGCGLPVVSSDRPFNYDVLNSENAILIDPENVGDIDRALTELARDGQRRAALGEKSLLAAGRLSIQNRAEGILRFMESSL